VTWCSADQEALRGVLRALASVSHSQSVEGLIHAHAEFDQQAAGNGAASSEASGAVAEDSFVAFEPSAELLHEATNGGLRRPGGARVGF